MDDLLRGYRDFRTQSWPELKPLFWSLAARGQAPKSLVIACSDSRIDPQLIFRAAPGEIFVVRNVANLVPPYQPDAEYHGTSAALEFAVRTLKVPHIIVLGHSFCGGVGALLKGPDGSFDFVSHWMSIAEPARETALASAAQGVDEEQVQRLCEHEVIKVSLRNLRTFPWVEERVQAENLKLHGMLFDIETGNLEVLDAASGTFAPLALENVPFR
ncbi:carbonic anhydrase [Rhodoligotrophos defluvii]|uniref:carbonic anhydrase n=1 Tax=Rhodoligotrophos defluvii TaxID=2561934 RepID=UPI0010C9EFE1|nr:carbonic anhydrase [Rhodoligotrophos defluvii]